MKLDFLFRIGFLIFGKFKKIAEIALRTNVDLCMDSMFETFKPNAGKIKVDPC